jgi:hypothetical protein
VEDLPRHRRDRHTFPTRGLLAPSCDALSSGLRTTSSAFRLSSLLSLAAAPATAPDRRSSRGRFLCAADSPHFRPTRQHISLDDRPRPSPSSSCRGHACSRSSSSSRSPSPRSVPTADQSQLEDERGDHQGLRIRGADTLHVSVPSLFPSWSPSWSSTSLIRLLSRRPLPARPCCVTPRCHRRPGGSGTASGG